ncbi:MAG TPA: methylated-DNA--[protein]-cysteine S-methyltransferase [Acholeplasmataceae bacterium]|nr:methylated-DNA--[protein]-cysteine S-methyltransferase [Acholeplasmataceae bacterium]
MINFYNTKLGVIAIKEENNAITEIFLTHEKENIKYESNLMKKAYQEICEYLEGKRKTFTFKINPKGTTFQRKVWAKLTEIPYGKTASYKEIAEGINNPKAYRAVGMANNKNPIMIVIPCHRVIGSDGTLVGYGGGLEVKEYLLNLERENNGNI